MDTWIQYAVNTLSYKHYTHETTWVYDDMIISDDLGKTIKVIQVKNVPQVIKEPFDNHFLSLGASMGVYDVARSKG